VQFREVEEWLARCETEARLREQAALEEERRVEEEWRTRERAAEARRQEEEKRAREQAEEREREERRARAEERAERLAMLEEEQARVIEVYAGRVDEDFAVRSPRPTSPIQVDDEEEDVPDQSGTNPGETGPVDPTQTFGTAFGLDGHPLGLVPFAEPEKVRVHVVLSVPIC
jgi:dTMP kinase